MAGDTYEERRQDLIAEYEKYLDEHGGRVLLRPDITIRLDFMNLTLIENRVLLEQMLAHLGVTVPESTPGETPAEETLSLKWEATEPEEIFRQALLTADTFYGDRMVDWTRGKRLHQGGIISQPAGPDSGHRQHHRHQGLGYGYRPAASLPG